jgi:hypothetical protein
MRTRSSPKQAGHLTQDIKYKDTDLRMPQKQIDSAAMGWWLSLLGACRCILFRKKFVYHHYHHYHHRDSVVKYFGWSAHLPQEGMRHASSTHPGPAPSSSGPSSRRLKFSTARHGDKSRAIERDYWRWIRRLIFPTYTVPLRIFNHAM